MELTIRANGVDLPATLSLPDGPTRGGVVALHGSHMGKRDFFLYEHLAHVLPPQGIAVLRYDRRPSRSPDIFPVPYDDAMIEWLNQPGIYRP